MTVLTGLLILTAVLVAAALTVLGTIAAAAEILPPWFGERDEAVNATVSGRRAPLLRVHRSETTGTRA